MEIKVLGTECAASNSLERFVNKAINDLSIDAKITKVVDIIEIFKYNVVTLPAIVIDNKVVAKGKVSFDEIKDLLADNSSKYVYTDMYLS
ncbi:MAG: thioredoxin family protein [Bacteroidales bacterium]|jgi:small redox-active disulfide protein 2|nr:thioredoxin family protein [Bacteroidales bacterium]